MFPLLRARVAQLTARRAKNVADLAFKPCTPMKNSSGLGDFYGTIGGKVKYVEQGSFMHTKKKGDFVSMPPNIVTNPVKKARIHAWWRVQSTHTWCLPGLGELLTKMAHEWLLLQGSYGYCKTTLSEKHPERKTKGVAGEYEYLTEPFEGVSLQSPTYSQTVF